MTTPSKQVQLSKIEQDALHYRVLRRFLAHATAAELFNTQQLDASIEQEITIADVAQILIDATQPSLKGYATSAAIEADCVTIVREIAHSIARGIYQPMIPQDLIALQACANLAEKAEATALPHVQSALSDAFRLHFALAVLSSPNQSVRISLALAKDYREGDYDIERKDELDACIFTMKRKPGV